MVQKKTTIERQKEFLQAYAEVGTIMGACNSIGLARSTLQGWRDNNTSFKEQFETARNQFVEYRRFDSGGGDPAKELMQEFRQQVKDAAKEKQKPKKTQSLETEVENLLKDKGIVRDSE